MPRTSASVKACALAVFHAPERMRSMTVSSENHRRCVIQPTRLVLRLTSEPNGSHMKSKTSTSSKSGSSKTLA
jgi:hypothetical protein